MMANWLNNTENKAYFIEQMIHLDSQIVDDFYKWNERYGMIEQLFDLMTCNFNS